MERQAALTPTGSRLRPPSDGIVSIQRARGDLAERWLRALKPLSRTHHAQLARGRTLARSGRVRDLWFAPGLASAEVVVGKETFRVSVRVQCFTDREWEKVVRVLLKNLGHIGAMLEGQLPNEMISELEKRKLTLFPSPDELDGDCDCSDYMLPCAHMSAVHYVVSDALDGDPFTLLTLRGRTRDQLLARLRRAWGDPDPVPNDPDAGDDPPPEDDWTTAPTPIQRPRFKVKTTETAAAGLRALGPPPGGVDLIRTLSSLYTAGAEAAFALAHREAPEPDPRLVRSREEEIMAKRLSVEAKKPMKVGSLTERLVDVLAKRESAKSKELAEALGVSTIDVRNELLDLEKLGIVYRTGQTRGTRWWLG